MESGRILLLAALAFASPARAQPPARDAWLADYALLKQRLESDHANLAWFGSPQGGVDLPALDRRTLDLLRSAANADQARLAIRDFVAAFDDGHFSVLPSSATEGGAANPEPPTRAAGADPRAACAALGYANRSPVGFSLPFESLPSFELLEDGETNSFRSGILTVNGLKVGIVRIRNFGLSQYPVECRLLLASDPAAARLAPAEFEDRVQRQWLSSLAAVARTLRGRGAGAIIVDVGSNSGGNDSGDWAARIFTARPLRSARLRMTAGPLTTEYLDGEIAQLREALAATTDARSRRAGEAALQMLTQRRLAVEARRCDMSWVWSEQRPWGGSPCDRLADAGFASGVVDYLPAGEIPDLRIARRVYWPALVDPLGGTWRGPLYVLVNDRTYSSAEMFAAVLQNNGAAQVAGARSGGDGCGFMVETEPVALPALGLRVRIGNCVRLRSDGSNEVAGITPDLPVLPRSGESARARAMRFLQTIAGGEPSIPPVFAGEIAASDPVDAQGRHYDEFGIDLERGQQIYALVTAASESRAAPVIKLYPPDGSNAVAGSDDHGPDIVAPILFTAPQDGLYRMRVLGSGRYRLEVFEIGAIQPGAGPDTPALPAPAVPELNGGPRQRFILCPGHRRCSR